MILTEHESRMLKALYDGTTVDRIRGIGYTEFFINPKGFLGIRITDKGRDAVEAIVANDNMENPFRDE